jgi:hypothetical protein
MTGASPVPFARCSSALATRGRYGVVRVGGNEQNARLLFAWLALDVAGALRNNSNRPVRAQ